MKTTQKQRAMLRRDIAPNVAWMTSLLDDLDEQIQATEALRARCERLKEAVPDLTWIADQEQAAAAKAYERAACVVEDVLALEKSSTINDTCQRLRQAASTIRSLKRAARPEEKEPGGGEP